MRQFKKKQDQNQAGVAVKLGKSRHAQSRSSADVHRVLHLQNTIGNRGVLKLFQSQQDEPVTQSKTLRAKPAGVLQRRVNPEDVASEMAGQAFVVSGPFTIGEVRLSGGETVYVVSWDNDSDFVRVRMPLSLLSRNTPFDIPKTLVDKFVTINGVVTYGLRRVLSQCFPQWR